MSGICDKCRREPCRIRMDGLKMCDLYEGGETNWERLFGTPERAARTLANLVANCNNGFCFAPEPENATYDAMLELLRGDAE